MLSELHKLDLNFCKKQYYKIDFLHWIVVPRLSGGWQQTYSTKTRLAGCANAQSMYTQFSMVLVH
jgi:hypothetical protein